MPEHSNTESAGPCGGDPGNCELLTSLNHRHSRRCKKARISGSEGIMSGRNAGEAVHPECHEQICDPGTVNVRAGADGLPDPAVLRRRFAADLKDAQATYRTATGPILVSGVPRESADAGTIGTAADWMMRFLVHAAPSLGLAAQGASLCGMLPALKELAFMLGFRDGGTGQFTGSAQGTGTEPDLLYRTCWGLALLTEVYRRGPDIAALGPLGRLPRKSETGRNRGRSGTDVESLVSPGCQRARYRRAGRRGCR
jgi:hypothetical protein